MTLSREQVQHMAELAQLALDEDELRLYRDQLSAILEHFERLQAVDTAAISPTATVLPLCSVMREDEPAVSLDHEQVLANAPTAEAGCFSVPAVLE